MRAPACSHHRHRQLRSDQQRGDPTAPGIVIASRVEVLFPSETSTRSGFGTCADSAIRYHSRSQHLSSEFSDAFTHSGIILEGCHAAVFMDK